MSPPGGAERQQRSADREGRRLVHDEGESAAASVYPWQRASAGHCSAVCDVEGSSDDDDDDDDDDRF